MNRTGPLPSSLVHDGTNPHRIRRILLDGSLSGFSRSWRSTTVNTSVVGATL
ncbi:hypothetical protein N806_20775 [Rhodococcus sp. P27]|nr:hypothetical protein N806_20775 [Rhodococcus sp. P27]